MDLTFATHLSPADDAPQALRAVDDGLGAFNDREPALQEVRPLAVFAHDANGVVAGGAVGRRWGVNAELQQLWVDERWRGRGVGAGLLVRFEAAAAAAGCRLVYLETFSFQAPGFYARAGYETVLLVQGYSAGIERHTMHKRLAAPTAISLAAGAPGAAPPPP